MHMCVEKSWLPCQGFTWTEDDHSRDAKHRLPHDLLNVNERHGKHQQAGYIDVASTPTSRKDATPRCPSSSRFIQEHFTLQCRNGNPPNNPGACLKYPTDSSQSPQSRNGSPLVHSKWRHLRRADEAWHLCSAGSWDVAKSEVMRKSGAGHKTWQPSRAPSWGGSRTRSSQLVI